MKFRKLPMPERLFISIGLLLVTVPNLISDWFHVPDAIRGFAIGLGLGMEIIGLIRLMQKRKDADVAC